jgi:hypothetical protein
MLIRNDSNSRSEIQRHIEDVIVENARYQRELRSYHREELVCPVLLTFADESLEDQHCVSRNISPAGISLFSSIEFATDLTATMAIYRLKQASKKQLIAVCRWCRPFGEQYWMSGWQFQRLIVLSGPGE